MKVVHSKPESLTDLQTHYCPGCTHGITHRLVAECIDELGMRERSIGVYPVGCAVMAGAYFNVDMVQAAHGRAPAVATGLKRSAPESLVFTYQGDGDLAAIGMGETVHAALRGEKVTLIFINNAIYGMTGGQMAPTSLLGQVTTTSPFGREAHREGYPVRMAEMLATADGAAYISRVSTHSPGQVLRAKKAIKKAFEYQLKGLGFTMVEILSTCPTNWGLNPQESLKWVEEKMVPVFPLGVFADKEGK